jgi:hypothetical protein
MLYQLHSPGSGLGLTFLGPTKIVTHVEIVARLQHNPDHPAGCANRSAAVEIKGDEEISHKGQPVTQPLEEVGMHASLAFAGSLVQARGTRIIIYVLISTQRVLYPLGKSGINSFDLLNCCR